MSGQETPSTLRLVVNRAEGRLAVDDDSGNVWLYVNDSTEPIASLFMDTDGRLWLGTWVGDEWVFANGVDTTGQEEPLWIDGDYDEYEPERPIEDVDTRGRT